RTSGIARRARSRSGRTSPRSFGNRDTLTCRTISQRLHDGRNRGPRNDRPEPAPAFLCGRTGGGLQIAVVEPRRCIRDGAARAVPAAGPWAVLADIDFMSGMRLQTRTTPDADPGRVYHNIGVAIDPSRPLFNGQPGTLA